jgi:sugar phosphate isomerase/epimerase
MLRIGLNPYGLAYTVGLQGAGTPRANPDPIGLSGFLDVARELGAAAVELHHGWLAAMPRRELARLAADLARDGTLPIVSAGLAQQPGETLEEIIDCARELGAPTIRLGLTPVVEGARSQWGGRWTQMAAHAAATLVAEAPRADRAGVTIAIENHQDFGSEELVTMAEAAGPNVGIVLDTGNPFAVGEDPVAFALRAAHRVRHVHLKDYVAQFTDEGYRLVRCAIGDGSVPFDGITGALRRHHTSLTASLEPGALEGRHIRLFTREWWQGYGPRGASELAVAIGRLRGRRLADVGQAQTPWELHAPPREIIEYEMSQIRRSADNMRREHRDA